MRADTIAPPQPTAFDLTSENGWRDLERELSDLHSEALDSILALARGHNAIRALLEPRYMDADYRNEFASFYAQTHRTVGDACRRLHFFSANEEGGERYLGFSVLRPIRSRPVGRTFMLPLDELDPYVSCRASASAQPLGHSLNVLAFPFMEQDTQFGVCAHTAVWMVALYHHLNHSTPRRLVSEIVNAADMRQEGWRSTPSEGLSDAQVGASLQQLGLSPLRYVVDDPPRGESIFRVVCRYLNSRLPVLLTTSEHVTVLIGYGRDTAGRLFFVRCDESNSPYELLYADEDPLGAWDLLIVALPGRIYMPAEIAERFARIAFRALLSRDEHADLRRRLPKNSDNYRLRTYAVNAGEYKRRLEERGMPPDTAAAHRLVGTSKWIWIVELQDAALAKRTSRCVLGEIAIDPTSDELEPNRLFGNLTGRRYTWDDVAGEQLEAPAAVGEPYKTGTAVHDAPTASPLARTPTSVRRWMRRRQAQLQRMQRRRQRPLRR